MASLEAWKKRTNVWKASHPCRISGEVGQNPAAIHASPLLSQPASPASRGLSRAVPGLPLIWNRTSIPPSFLLCDERDDDPQAPARNRSLPFWRFLVSLMYYPRDICRYWVVVYCFDWLTAAAFKKQDSNLLITAIYLMPGNPYLWICFCWFV